MESLNISQIVLWWLGYAAKAWYKYCLDSISKWLPDLRFIKLLCLSKSSANIWNHVLSSSCSQSSQNLIRSSIFIYFAKTNNRVLCLLEFISRLWSNWFTIVFYRIISSNSFLLTALSCLICFSLALSCIFFVMNHPPPNW